MLGRRPIRLLQCQTSCWDEPLALRSRGSTELFTHVADSAAAAPRLASERRGRRGPSRPLQAMQVAERGTTVQNTAASL